MKFRPNVALVLQNPGGHILICERSDWPGSWQFPQGGVKPGEAPLDALEREVREELGLDAGHYRVLQSSGPHRYVFDKIKRRRGFDGQEQTYYLAETTADPPPINLGTRNPEFIAARWIPPRDYNLAWLAGMKHPVYRRVFHDFFGIELPDEA
jgi:putative (di)nucleoside polyphosphate hydrolase